MKPISSDLLLSQLHWRYAVKKFDAARKLSAAEWQPLEEALVLSASSFGLQPWKFLVITDHALRERLKPVSWNQTQVTDCSHYVVFAAKTSINEVDIDAFLARTAEIRGVAVESLAGYRQVIVQSLIGRPDIHEWARRQTYLALGNLLTSAALVGVDTCPMEGIDAGKYDELLGLSAQGYATAMACAVGYRSAEDKYARAPKVRYPSDQVIKRI